MDIPKLLDILRAVPAIEPNEFRLWVERASYLTTHPESLEFGKWGWGDLARSGDGT